MIIKQETAKIVLPPDPQGLILQNNCIEKCNFISIIRYKGTGRHPIKNQFL
jgi:hypothetical protein